MKKTLILAMTVVWVLMLCVDAQAFGGRCGGGLFAGRVFSGRLIGQEFARSTGGCGQSASSVVPRGMNAPVYNSQPLFAQPTTPRVLSVVVPVFQPSFVQPQYATPMVVRPTFVQPYVAPSFACPYGQCPVPQRR